MVGGTGVCTGNVISWETYGNASSIEGIEHEEGPGPRFVDMCRLEYHPETLKAGVSCANVSDCLVTLLRYKASC